MLRTVLACKATSTLSAALTTGLLSAALLLSGCGSTGGGLSGLRLYSPERDKQGQAAREAWAKVDLKSQLEVPRQSLAKTLAEQVAVEEDIWMKRRSIVAKLMAGNWTVVKFNEEAGKGLMRVTGLPNAPAAAASAASYRDAVRAVETARELLDSPTSRMTIAGIAPPSCSVALDKAELVKYNETKLKSVSEEAAALYTGSLDGLVAACRDIAKAQKGIVSSGMLGQARKELEDDVSAFDKEEAAAEVLLSNLKAAQAAYVQADEEIKGNPSQAKDKVNKALDKLKAFVKELPASGNPDADNKNVDELLKNAIATKLFSQERLDSINKFLATYDSVVKGEGAEKGSSRLAIALALFPDLQQKTHAALADAARPNLTPLVLRKNIEQAKVGAANRDIERRQTVIALRKQIVASLEAQMSAYLNAYDASRQVKAGTKWSDALQAIDESSGKKVSDSAKNEKIAAWKASAQFLEAEGRLRADTGQNYYRIYALQSSGALLYAESSIQQWQGLIDPSVDLLAQWSASGVKSDDLIQLFNSLMLLGIAIGVN